MSRWPLVDPAHLPPWDDFEYDEIRASRLWIDLRVSCRVAVRINFHPTVTACSTSDGTLQYYHVFLTASPSSYTKVDCIKYSVAKVTLVDTASTDKNVHAPSKAQSLGTPVGGILIQCGFPEPPRPAHAIACCRHTEAQAEGD